MFIPKETYIEILLYVPIPTVDMVLINKNNEILLGMRNNKPLQGIYYLPGGRVWKGETLLQAVKRKAKEELGLDIQPEKFVGVYDDILEGSAFPGIDTTHCIASTFCYHLSDEDIKKIHYDQQHDSFKFFTYDDPSLDPYLLDRLSTIQSSYSIF